LHRLQADLVAPDHWILEGDLGAYDDCPPRLERADTVVVLDLAAWVCAWRILRRGREGRDFLRWMLRWRTRSPARRSSGPSSGGRPTPTSSSFGAAPPSTSGWRAPAASRRS